MVQRYNSSTAVQTAPVARPQSTGVEEIAGAVRQLAQTVNQETMRKVDERTAALESAALNDARIQLAKRGGELAIELQKDRVAGSNYVPDLENARKQLKQEIWSGLPGRVQNSTRARAQWDDIWTSDEISATRAAVGWQMDQEKGYALQSIDNGLLAMSAEVEANPASVTQQLAAWSKSLPTYGGLLDKATLDEAQTKGVQALIQGAVRGFSKAGQFDEATKLVTDMAAQLRPEQRAQYENVIEDAKNEIEQEQRRQKAELAERQRETGNQYEVNILDGKVTRQMIDAGVKSGEISINDQPALIRALREEQDRKKREAEAAVSMTAAERQARENVSADFKAGFDLLAMSDPALFMSDRTAWPKKAQDAFANLTDGHQRAVIGKQVEMKMKGVTPSAINSVMQDVLAEAKRFGPKQMDDKENKDYFRLQGILYTNAEKLSAERGGVEITSEQARRVVLQSFKEYDAKTYGVGVDAAFARLEGRSAVLWNQVREALKANRPGNSEPSYAEIAAAYDALGAN